MCGFTSILTVCSWLLSVLCISRNRAQSTTKSELQWSKINPLLCPSFTCLPLQVVFPPPPPPSPDHSPFPPPNLLLLPTNSDPLEQHRGGQLVLSLWIMISLEIKQLGGRSNLSQWQCYYDQSHHLSCWYWLYWQWRSRHHRQVSSDCFSRDIVSCNLEKF